MRVLIVDDEPNIRRTLRLALEAVGHTVSEAASVAEALRVIERRPCDAALVDLKLGEDSGLDLIRPLLEQLPRLAIIVITAHASIDSAVEVMRRGAFDYLPKPFTPAQVRAVLERVTRLRGLRERVAVLEEQVHREVPEADFQGARPSGPASFRAGPTGRVERCRHPDPGRERHRQGGLGSRTARLERAATGRSSPSVAPASAPSCSKVSSSATSEARSPAQCATPPARSRRRKGVRCFSTRWATFPRRSNPSSCGSCRTINTSGSAIRGHGPPMSV